MTIDRAQIEDFLYHEAELLDNWQLKEWSELFAPEAYYLVPPTDRPHADHRDTLFIIADDRYKLGKRAERLLKREVHVEYPHPTTIHSITNVRLKEIKDDVMHAVCNLTVHPHQTGSFRHLCGPVRL